ncbi:MAG: O-antigen ligase family protein [Verrucomicrobiota bacterium]
MGLLLGAPLVGIFLFGAVRMWSFGPLMFLAFLGVGLFCLRPFFATELQRVQGPPGGLLWILFFLYGLCLMPSAAVPYEVRVELLRIGSYIGAYWAWTELASRHKRWRVLLGILLFAVTLMAWYAVIQQCRGSRLVLNLVRPEGYGMRASGTYFCPNHFANLLEMVIPMAFALVLAGSAGVPLRLLSGYSLLLFLPVLFMTQSRSGWIATAAGLSATALVIAARRSRKMFFSVLVLLPTLLLLAAAVLWVASPMVRERLTGASPGAPDPAVQARLLMWRDTVHMIRDRPWVGHGLGSYQWVYPQYKSHNMQLLFNYAHNEYLHTLAESGIVGFGLLAVLVVSVLFRLLRWSGRASRDKDAFLLAGLVGSIAASLAHAVFDFNFHLFANNHVLVLLAGTVVAGLYVSDDVKAVALPPRWSRAAWGAGALAAFVMALAVAQAFVGYGFHFLGERDRARFRMQEAVREYRASARVDPGNWRAYLGLANVDQSRSFWNLDAAARQEQAAQSLTLYERARALNPYDMDVLFGMSKACNVLGDRERSLELLREIVKRDPYHQFYAVQLGLRLRSLGRDEEALAVFEKAQEMGDNEAVPLNIEALHKKLSAEKAARAESTPL